jgi:hypothetical protein
MFFRFFIVVGFVRVNVLYWIRNKYNNEILFLQVCEKTGGHLIPVKPIKMSCIKWGISEIV